MSDDEWCAYCGHVREDHLRRAAACQKCSCGGFYTADEWRAEQQTNELVDVVYGLEPPRT